MTEQKLDVKTLEHIRNLLVIEVNYYNEKSKHIAECGDYYDADRFDAKRAAMQNFERLVNRLIKQQEVAA